MRSLPERFWSKVNRTDDCWLWTGAIVPRGYGRMSVGLKSGMAHRISWQLNNGPIPQGQCVLHKCDVPGCVRPDHLWIGSKSDNIKDREQKGRTAKGENAGPSKLTENDILTIRLLDIPQKSLAALYQVSQPNIHCIKRKKSWKHL